MSRDRHAPGMERVRSTPAQRIGDEGERLVAARLEAAGWTILARNLRLGRRRRSWSWRCGGEDGGTSGWRRSRSTGASARRSGAPWARCSRRARCRTDGPCPGWRCGWISSPSIRGRTAPPASGIIAALPCDPRTRPGGGTGGALGGGTGGALGGAPRSTPCATLPPAVARPRRSPTPVPAVAGTELTRGSPTRSGRCPTTGRERAGTRLPPGIRGGMNRRRSPSAHRLDAPAA